MSNRVMKGEQCHDLSIVRLPVLVQPKFDGIRVCKQNGVALSGQLKPVPNRLLAAAIEQHCPDNIDCEFWWPGTKFEMIQSVFRSQDKALPDGWQLQVFDLMENRMTALERQNKLTGMMLPDFAGLVSTTLCKTLGQIKAVEGGMLEEGYEGIMMRNADGGYKFGRSTLNEQWLMKRKPFVDDEALVVGFVEKEHNDNPIDYNERGLAFRSSSKDGKRPAGVLGALVVSHPKFGTFNIGTGFTDADRTVIWNNRELYLYKLVTFKYQANHVKDAPCPAVFKAFRS